MGGDCCGTGSIVDKGLGLYPITIWFDPWCLQVVFIWISNLMSKSLILIIWPSLSNLTPEERFDRTSFVPAIVSVISGRSGMGKYATHTIIMGTQLFVVSSLRWYG